MRLRIFLPTEVMVDREVEKISAEGEDGAFTLLARHIDFVTALAPGILSFVTPEGQEEFLAVDQGVLVKQGREVRVSALDAVRGPGLGQLRQAVAERFRRLDERQRKSRSVLARLEADFARRLFDSGRQ